MPESDLVERLKTAMRNKSINARELAEKADVGASFVYDILNGKSSNPTTKKLSSVAQVLGVSVPYLLHGTRAFHDFFSSTPLASSSNSDELVAIPSVAVEASMGGGSEVAEEATSKPYYFHRSWIRQKLKTSPADLRIIFVRGDSMLPTLDDNDMVLVDVSRKSPTPPGIFVLFDGIGLVVKRLEYLGDKEEPLIRIISDNRKYGPYERGAMEVNIIGRVVWFARQLI